MTLGSPGVGETVTLGYPAVGGDEVASTSSSADVLVGQCLRETSLLYLLLTLGTAWVGLSLYNFTKTYVQRTV